MAQALVDNGEDAIRIMRQLGECALEEKFADLVRLGLKLRAGIETGEMIDRQGAFVNRSGNKN
jgi:class 3 adenylate cyclase